MAPRRECVGGEEGGKDAGAGMWTSAKMLVILILVLGREMTVFDCRSMSRG